MPANSLEIKNISAIEYNLTTMDGKNRWTEMPVIQWTSITQNIETGKGRIHQMEIHDARRLHTILGMGYSFEHTSCQNLMRMVPADRKHALQMLVDPTIGAGMNLWRICVGTPDFTGTPWYSYCDTPPPPNMDPVAFVDQSFSIEKDREFIIPVVQEALALNPNILIYASPWSPPGWMKNTGIMCGGTLLFQYRAAYARYLVKFVQAYGMIGIPIYAITVQNEPYHNWKKMPSCLWQAAWERDFIRDFLGPAFRAAGLKTQIWCYDHNWDDIPGRPAKYPQIILKDPQAAQYVQGVAFHHYSALGWSNPKLMLKFRKRIPYTVGFYFTEGSLFWLWGALRLIRYIRFGAQSYSGWVPMLDTEGQPNNGPFKAKESLIQLKVPELTLQINSDYWWKAHIMRSIQRGAVVLRQDRSSANGFESLALLNPDLQIVVICVNKNKKSHILAVKWKDNSFNFEMPAESLCTFRWKVN